MIRHGIAALLAIGLTGCTTVAPTPSPNTAPASLAWPDYGPDTNVFRVDAGLDRNDGLTNAIPDMVGPIDGSARLTIFTEGNHYPVLLPLLLEDFPHHCAQTRLCDVAPDQILVVTLPQVMIVAGMQQGGFRFGNATLPVGADTPAYPDLLMLGAGPMERLRDAGIIDGPERVFARHKGLGLLVRRGIGDDIEDLEGFVASDLPYVIATPRERGARAQYLNTLRALIGIEETAQLQMREVADFSGRLAIQHRDIPHAVMTDVAPVGIVFTHLAAFYAELWPDRLRHVAVPDAAAFGTEIGVARTARPAEDPALVEAFLSYLMERAQEVYPSGGFGVVDGLE